MLEQLFFFDAVEASYDVDASVPDWVRGSYYINGPARFERGGQRYNHWLDGDGMVCALHFGPGGVRFASRFVQTRKLRDEQAAGRFLYRGFGTSFDGDKLLRNVMLESPANVSVCLWEKRLLAFGEQSLPMELDPETLETIGEFDFGGNLNEVSPFAAHAKLDHPNEHLLNFGISHAARAMLNVYEFTPTHELLKRHRLPIALQHSNHDFNFTKDHAVFFLSPLILSVGRFLSDGASVMDALSWEPHHGSKILVVPRAGREGDVFEVEAGNRYCLHLINSFEVDGKLVIDILELDRPVYADYRPMPELFCDAPRCSPVRYVVDLESRALVERRAMSYDLCADFPSIDPKLQAREYNDFWFLGITATGKPGCKFFDQLARGSWGDGDVVDTYTAPAGEFLGGEPVLLPHPTNPSESLVLVQRLTADGRDAAFEMFPAFAVHRGPVARIQLKQRLHPLFHAAFYPR